MDKKTVTHPVREIDRSRCESLAGPAADSGLGQAVRCVCVSNPHRGTPEPVSLSGVFEVEYENGGKLTVSGRLCSALFFGWLPCGERFVADRRVVAALACAAARLSDFDDGEEVSLPGDAETDRIFKELNIPSEPREYGGDAEEVWFETWKRAGLLCEMDDGQLVIESALPDWAKAHIRSRFTE